MHQFLILAISGPSEQPRPDHKLFSFLVVLAFFQLPFHQCQLCRKQVQLEPVNLF